MAGDNGSDGFDAIAAGSGISDSAQFAIAVRTMVDELTGQGFTIGEAINFCATFMAQSAVLREGGDT